MRKCGKICKGPTGNRW